MSTFTELTTYQTLSCGRCGCHFAVTQDHYKTLLRTKQSFWCPNGHERHFVDSMEDKLRRQIAETEQRLESQKRETERARECAREAGQREEIAKGEAKRLLRRVTSGVCPCCNRTFQNLASHMKTKHPEHIQQEFTMDDRERRLIVSNPTCFAAREVRRKFVRAHQALSDTRIAELMIEGRLYASPHVGTVERAVANLRKTL